MANGKIINKTSVQGSISSPSVAKASVTKGGGGTFDHNRLWNCDLEDQHPIEAITGLRVELDSKLNAGTALPLIEDAVQNKAKGLYFDSLKELARKSYWYLTSEIDPITKMGTKDSIISGPYDLGMGGGSGGGGGSGLTTVDIQLIAWPTAVVVGNDQIKTDLKIRWSSSKEGTAINEAGTVYVRINGTQVKVLANQNPGEVIIEDITSYPAFATQDNKIEVEVMDIYGSTTKAVRTIKGISLKLSSNFTAGATTFINGNINYTYIPEGDAEKTVYFEIDGVPQTPVTTNVSKVEAKPYQIRGLSHGSHTLKVYFTANIGGQDVPSNTLFYDLICVDPNNPTPIIASDFTALTQEQYSSFEIPYYVYANGKTTLPITLKATSSEGETASNTQGTVGKRLSWPYRADSEGIHTLEIFCENAEPKRFEINVTKNEITVIPEANNVALALSAHNRKNDDVATRDLWTYTTDDIEPITYKCKFENFNWSSNGWIFKQEDQTSVLRVGAGAKVTIPLQLFGKHAEGTDGIVNAGRTIELDFSTHSIRNYDTPIISCLDKVTSDFYEIEESFEQADTRKEGFEVIYDYKTLNEALPCSEVKQSIVFTYKNESWINEDNIIINLTDYGITLESKDINPSGEDLGTAVDGDKIVIKYSKEHKGLQITPKLASLRSLKSYLEAPYKEDEHVRITFVIEPEIKENSSIKHQIIWVYINGIASAALNYPDGDDFIQKQAQEIEIGSTEAVVDIYNIRVYKSALTHKQIVNNWIADTPDMATRAARFKHNDILNSSDEIIYDKLPTDLPYIIWGIDRLPTSKNDIRYGTARFVDPTNSKRNFTVIDGEYKVQGTSSALYPTKNIRLRTKKGKGGPNLEWYDDEGNDLIIKNGGKGFPITYPDGIGVDYFTFKVDYASSEGTNNVELTKLYNDASIKYGLLTPPQQKDSKVRVGIDGFPIAVFYKDPSENISFHTKANFNNDKANEDVYGFADGDESWETTNNSANVAKYKVELTADNWKDGFEGRFPEDNTDISKLQLMVDWVASTNRDPAVVTNAQLVDSHGNPISITFKYKDAKQSTDGKVITTEVTKTFDTDTAEYRLTKFKAELANWFNVDSCLFYYLFTELFLMIDSRAKNAFPTYFATRTNKLTVDDKGNTIPNTYTDGGNRWYWIPYDMDTAIGIDNKGKLVFDYNLEDIDTIEGGSAVYNGQDSVMWCNIRDAFAGELAAMYTTLRNQELISYDEIDKRFTEHQSKWPEVLLNIDAYNKYVTPLPGADYLAMLQGTKEQQRKWWLYNRFKYIDSKYTSGDAAADKISFRTYIKAGQEKPDIKVVPYASIYASVSYANGQDLVTARAKSRDVEVTLPNPFGVNEIYTDQEVAIYSASQLKSVGDLAGFYLDTLDISQATRLQELKVGDDRTKYPNYKNPHLKTLVVGNNDLLRMIDARNCTGLGTPGAGRTPSPDLRGCPNIEEIYFTGTQINGIQLPDGGTIKKLHLPGTLTSLKLQNQPLLEELYLDTLRTITRSTSQSEYSFTGMVVERGGWDKLNANANLYIADSTDPSSSIVKVNIADKTIYDVVVQNEEQNRPTLLNITCNYIDVQYDLVTNEEDNTESVQLSEYLTRKITQLEQITELDPAKTIAKLVLSISDTIEAPKVAEYKVTSFEELWLENLPSNVIKAREFVTNMRRPTKDDPSKTGIYIIGINETFVDTYDEEGKVVRKAWEQIEDFYDLLDQHCGVDVTGSGTKPEKAQISGIINIDEISYTKYIELTSRYPEITINAKRIICTITFYNEGKLHYSTNIAISTSLDSMNKLVLIGQQINFPETPIKLSTQANYYVFNSWKDDQGNVWAPDSFIAQNLNLIATYDEKVQQYSVVFNPNSDIISINPTEAIYYYGDKIIPPTIITDLVELNVELEGWKTINGETWDFDKGTITGPLELVASWKDENIPTIQLFRENYNTFRYEATDNLGIIGWAVVKDSAEEPTEWNSINATTSLKDTYTINSAGEYYFWITDSKNVAFAKLVADKIIVTTTSGVAEYTFTEGDHTFESDFALRGTTLKLNTVLDEHYKNLEIYISDTEASLTPTFTVDSQSKIDILCSPKSYLISFDLSGKGDSEKAPEQLVTYLHYVEAPAAQYWQASGEIIDSWYLEPAFINRWNFETDQVTGDITLYAKWVNYHRPSILTIEIPEDGDHYIYVNYSQYKIDSTHKVLIDWGDNSTNSSSTDEATIRLGHEYAKAGTYQISIWGPGGGNATYLLGNNISYNIINPIEYLVDIDLSWDVARLAPGAFRGSSLKTPNITQYMSEISTDCYANCSKLEEIIIPDNIIVIEDQAFSACRNAKGYVVIPNSVQRIGTSAFANCDSITRFELLCDCDSTPILANEICRGDIGLKEIAISEHLTIPYRMFSWCSGLERLTINNKLEDNVFESCTGLKELVSNSASFGDRTFIGCSNLEKVVLTNPNLVFGDYTFDGCSNLHTFGPISDIENEYDFSFAWETEIPAKAFQRSWDAEARKSVKEVTLPKKLLKIGELAFHNATTLSQILVNGEPVVKNWTVLPSTLREIDNNAFEACTSLRRIEIPATVDTIGPRAFGGCTALVAIIINTSAISPKIDVFEDALFKNNSFLPNLTIYVPIAVLEDEVTTDNYGKFWNACSTKYDESGNEIIEYIMVKEATPANLKEVR